MHIQFIGQNLTQFYEKLLRSNKIKCIQKFWNFEKIKDNSSTIDQINEYFQFLENEKNNSKRDNKEILIIKVKNMLESEIDNCLNKMNNLE